MTGCILPIRPAVSSLPAASPSRELARPLRHDAVTLGLDRPTALLGGGHALLPCGLYAADRATLNSVLIVGDGISSTETLP